MLNKKFLFSILIIIGLGFSSEAQKLSARAGLLPNDWLRRQGVPAFFEAGVEYAPVRYLSAIASYKLFINSFEQMAAYGRPGSEFSFQPRFYFDIEEYNDGPFIAFPISYAIHGKYTAINLLTSCQTTYHQSYREYSIFLGYKTAGRWGVEFFGGPSRRITDFYKNSTCGETPNIDQTVGTYRKWLLEVGVRFSYRIL